MCRLVGAAGNLSEERDGKPDYDLTAVNLPPPAVPPVVSFEPPVPLLSPL